MKIAEPARRYVAKSQDRAAARTPERITVRLKPEMAKRLDEVRKARKLSVTAAIEQALEGYLGSAEAPRKLTLLEAMKKHGVLGAVDLGPNASRDYKKLAADSIARKYGHR